MLRKNLFIQIIQSFTQAFLGIFGLLVKVPATEVRVKWSKYEECVFWTRNYHCAFLQQMLENEIMIYKDLLRDPLWNQSPVAMLVFKKFIFWTKTLSSPHHLQIDVTFEPGIFLANVNIRKKGETESFVLLFMSFYVTYFCSLK